MAKASPIAISIVDEIMGTGKTVAALRYMQEAGPRERFIFITPFLDEVARVQKVMGARNIRTPKSASTKTDDIKRLLQRKVNIVTTHALFKRFDDEILELVRAGKYTLIVDEELDVVDQYPTYGDDLKIVKLLARPNADGVLRIRKNGERGCLCPSLYNLITYRDVRIYADTSLMHTPRFDTFRAFKKIILMTYMFDAQMQKCYFDIYQTQYERLYVEGDAVENYRFTSTPVERPPVDYSALIHIVEDERLNEIGEERTDLCSGWYDRAAKNGKGLRQLRNNLLNLFRRKLDARSADIMWTTYKKYRAALTGAGYARGFLTCTARATNTYKDKNVLAYTVNLFMDPFQRNFFLVNGAAPDDGAFALSSMLQWLWRSALRMGKEVTLYVPSSRMRGLLKAWIEENKPRQNEDRAETVGGSAA